MRLGVIGTGYVGLVTGACFADAGHAVLCADKDALKIQKLREGAIPIYEPGLEEIVERATKNGRLTFTTSNIEVATQCEIIFFAVGTPSQTDGSADLSFLKMAVEEVATALKQPAIFVMKSTVPVGTYHKVCEWISAKTKQKFEVVGNPEFLKEGSAVVDFQKPDRVIVGTKSDAAFEKISELYAPFVRQGNPILKMDPTSAEISKYASNAFLATRISFMNEISHLCERTGGDVEFVRQGMTTDTRIGKHFLYAGAGYGGSCFPKDVKALMHTGRENSVPLRIVTATEDANAFQKRVLFSKMSKHFGGDAALKGKRIAVLGIAFKPMTDDIREAPAIVLIEALLNAGASVSAFDPVAQSNAQKVFGEKVRWSDSFLECVQDADAMALVTEWNEFRNPEFEKLKAAMRAPVVFDGRNLYSPKKMRDLGFTYYGIGRN